MGERERERKRTSETAEENGGAQRKR